MQKLSQKKIVRPPQHQQKPGKQSAMKPIPVSDDRTKLGTGKLKNKIALISGADSGIGKAVALLFAKEGATIGIAYLNEHSDAKQTKKEIEQQYGQTAILLPGDISKEQHCIAIIKKMVKNFGRIDILVNNAAVQYENKDLLALSSRELIKTFETNIFSFFWLSKASLPFMKKGSCIINTSSVTAYRGSAVLIDYASTKGAIVSFTRSLAASLIKKGIRVNGVAPGPVWTPLIASGYKKNKVAQHGSDSPMGRSAEPVEIAPSYLFLASEDASYMTGQVLHPNGGEIING